jgi:hypothetical protein
MYESQHHINISKNMARYKQVVRTPYRLQLATVYIKVYFGVKTITLPPSKPTVVFSLNEGDDKITLLDVFYLMEHIKRGEFLFVHNARSGR